MNTRSMRAPRRVDTRWPQTIVMHRAHRQIDSPYRRTRRRPDWGRVLDLLCWCVVWAAGALSAALILRATVAGLARLWS